MITLGVIGIVAAMTLPMLAENYQRVVVQTRLKKFYTTFNQALMRAAEDHGSYDMNWGYWVFQEKGDDGVQIVKTNYVANSFDYYLRPYLNITQTQEVNYIDGTRTYLYYLSDGSAFAYDTRQNSDVHYYPKNPVKCFLKPATERSGICLFHFFASPRSSNAYKYHMNKGLEPYMYNWDGKDSTLYEHPRLGCVSKGVFCTAIIQQNGWEFPKDYPHKIRY